MIVPTAAAHSDTVVAGQPLFTARWNQFFASPKQEPLQINLAGTPLLIVCKVNIRNF